MIMLPSMAWLVAGATAASVHHVYQRSSSPAPNALQNILKNTDGSDSYRYPTDFTRDIIPKAFHSHNDYWRDVPFYSALSYGAISTEADIWYINDTLFVGHELSALTPTRNLSTLYLEPLLHTLSLQNPDSRFIQSPTGNGVFDTSPTQTLYLFLDFKTGGDDTWPGAVAALQPLRDAGWLSEYDGTRFIERAVTVIGTGNTPLERVQAMQPRWIFYDAPLDKLSPASATSSAADPQGLYANITGDISPIASTNFANVFGRVIGRKFNDTQLATLNEQVANAHSRGIMTRYWNQPGWPLADRNAVWRILWEGGVDLLNVDDLAGAADFWEGE